MNTSEKLISAYFLENSLIQSSIESFNKFIETYLQEIIDENKEIVPTIIPPDVEDFKIILNKIWVGKPEITEADGSKREIYPVEARLRKISYSAPIYLEVSSEVNGIQKEVFKTQIGNIPIMLKSNYCHLNGLSKEELVEKGEDPNDPGGYFIINGTERVVVIIEDLASNTFLVNKTTTGVSPFVGKLFSESGAYRIPHTIEQLRKDNIFYISLTRIRRIPLILLIKALGLIKDEEILKAIGSKYDSEVLINLFEQASLKTEEEAVDKLARKIGITQVKEIRLERTREILDRFLLPNIGITPEDRLQKAYALTKFIKKFLLVVNGDLPCDDKDHYKNKRLKMPGDLLADLFRVNIKVLIGDILYNFQRLVKRGKFPSVKVVIRTKLLTQRIYSMMATGSWVGGRKGVSQRLQRLNFLDTASHLQRVVSPLTSSQENFQARALHTTHLGRLCPTETPEGTNIGLRKNMALLARVSREIDETELLTVLKSVGLKEVVK